jgi:hypothetical protein
MRADVEGEYATAGPPAGRVELGGPRLISDVVPPGVTP